MKSGTPRNGAPRNGAKKATHPRGSDVVYDWNQQEVTHPVFGRAFELVDETLRDGCQSPSVQDPTIEDKIALLHLMDSLGIAWADIGLPGAGRRAAEDIAVLLREIAKHRLAIGATLACRTVVDPDVKGAVEVVQRTGQKAVVYAFIGSSPIRQWAEDWPLDFILKQTSDSISFAVKEGLDVVYVTEDTTRSHPKALDALFRAAVDAGAKGLCLCDTVGYVTPDGLTRLFRFTKDLLRGIGAEHVTLDWHGHNDRGLALHLALHAIELGFDRVHGTALGIGERVGNTSLDLLMLNLKLLEAWPHDTTRLVEYVRLASRATRVPIPINYPLSGRDAFRTATGVHAAAIIKAQRKNDTYLADRVYSGVPAGDFGREQEIEIGHMSGLSNVSWWLEKRHLDPDPELARSILAAAKQSNRVLTEDEVEALVKQWKKSAPGEVSRGKSLPAGAKRG
jgi:2-isopropylmalate synthase